MRAGGGEVRSERMNSGLIEVYAIRRKMNEGSSESEVALDAFEDQPQRFTVSAVKRRKHAVFVDSLRCSVLEVEVSSGVFAPPHVCRGVQ